MRPRRALTAGVVVALVVGIVTAVSVAGRKSTVGIEHTETRIFDARGRIDAAAADGELAYSPSGARLAVRTGNGVALVEEGRLRYVVHSPSIAAFAWFPGETALLVAEGPTPTGGVVVVQTDGRVRGTIPLKRSFGVGAGMAILPGGKRAVMVELDRDTFGGPERRRVVTVDLTTGEVSEPGDAVESRLLVLDDGRIVRGVGVLDGRLPIVLSGRRLTAGNHALGSVPAGATLLAVSPVGTEAVVVGPAGEPVPHRIRLKPPPDNDRSAVG